MNTLRRQKKLRRKLDETLKQDDNDIWNINIESERIKKQSN